MKLTRYFMYKRIARAIPKLHGKVLSIGPMNLPFEGILTKTQYPQIDMQNLPYPANTYDYVVSDQVLEHVENPVKAIAESLRVLKKGGIAIHTTCFINQFHPSPKDYWRFSPDALIFLCKDFSEIIQCESWGNWFAILLCFLGDRFRNIEIPERGLLHWLAIKNQERYPIVTWIIAKK